ncbi:hypothetical protein CR194_02305 [Salipaludibacillus keqinensis]|uniref:Uncharacterized protein n=1 Tax=Salipaludibacillus keqinensis TaxID=2045207 RepID=A0A323TXN8_9BACI|nr:hypothetical protein [Salipaludibacillus keqinensis]PYZ94385.1 hypothetical protein CR194_02305 [Salipaludibacillus keqinensis]
MTQLVREEENHHFILFLVEEVLTVHAKNEWPSPTIKQISYKIGCSEESILESLEFGTFEPVTLLQ